MDKRKSIQVDEQTWRSLKLMALEMGETLGEVVTLLTSAELLARGRLEVGYTAPATVLHAKKGDRMVVTATGLEIAPATGGASSAGQRAADRVAGMATLAAVDGEVRCQCGQRWKDHQGGESGKLAVATNCRRFQP